MLPPGSKLDAFNAPHVVDAKITEFDDTGLGTEPNNLAAINSLIAYRALRWGRHIDLLITDNRSFHSRDPGNHDDFNPLFEGDTLGFVPEELWAQFDAGREYAGGHPPAKLTMGDKSVANAAPQTTATWKVWGNSLGALDTRVRSALKYAETRDLQQALAVRNPETAPHLTFYDSGGHGYATVRVDANTMVTEFVCIPRPITRAATPDGGPLRYPVRHEVSLWQAGERPQLRKTLVEGDTGLAV